MIRRQKFACSYDNKLVSQIASKFNKPATFQTVLGPRTSDLLVKSLREHEPVKLLLEIDSLSIHELPNTTVINHICCNGLPDDDGKEIGRRFQNVGIPGRAGKV